MATDIVCGSCTSSGRVKSLILDNDAIEGVGGITCPVRSRLLCTFVGIDNIVEWVRRIGLTGIGSRGPMEKTKEVNFVVVGHL